MSNYFQNIISDKEFFETGPEIEDYQELVNEYFGLTDEKLKLNEFSYEHKDRGLTFKINVNNNEKLEYKIEHFSGYSEEITNLCNYVLNKIAPEEKRKFYALSSNKFDFCGAFLEPKILIELSDKQLIFLSPDDYGEIKYQIEKE